MNHWVEVAGDIWWFIKWPLLCISWMVAGIALVTEEKGSWAVDLFLAIATFLSVIVANGI